MLRKEYDWAKMEAAIQAMAERNGWGIDKRSLWKGRVNALETMAVYTLTEDQYTNQLKGRYCPFGGRANSWRKRGIY